MSPPDDLYNELEERAKQALDELAAWEFFAEDSTAVRARVENTFNYGWHGGFHPDEPGYRGRVPIDRPCFVNVGQDDDVDWQRCRPVALGLIQAGRLARSGHLAGSAWPDIRDACLTMFDTVVRDVIASG